MYIGWRSCAKSLTTALVAQSDSTRRKSRNGWSCTGLRLNLARRLQRRVFLLPPFHRIDLGLGVFTFGRP